MLVFVRFYSSEVGPAYFGRFFGFAIFETTDIQRSIRAGFADLLSGAIAPPPPFDAAVIAGPILNEGGLDELERALAREFAAEAGVFHAAEGQARIRLHHAVQRARGALQAS